MRKITAFTLHDNTRAYIQACASHERLSMSCWLERLIVAHAQALGYDLQTPRERMGRPPAASRITSEPEPAPHVVTPDVWDTLGPELQASGRYVAGRP